MKVYFTLVSIAKANLKEPRQFDKAQQPLTRLPTTSQCLIKTMKPLPRGFLVRQVYRLCFTALQCSSVKLSTCFSFIHPSTSFACLDKDINALIWRSRLTSSQKKIANDIVHMGDAEAQIMHRLRYASHGGAYAQRNVDRSALGFANERRRSPHLLEVKLSFTLRQIICFAKSSSQFETLIEFFIKVISYNIAS